MVQRGGAVAWIYGDCLGEWMRKKMKSKTRCSWLLCCSVALLLLLPCTVNKNRSHVAVTSYDYRGASARSSKVAKILGNSNNHARAHNLTTKQRPWRVYSIETLPSFFSFFSICPSPLLPLAAQRRKNHQQQQQPCSHPPPPRPVRRSFNTPNNPPRPRSCPLHQRRRHPATQKVQRHGKKQRPSPSARKTRPQNNHPQQLHTQPHPTTMLSLQQRLITPGQPHLRPPPPLTPLYRPLPATPHPPFLHRHHRPFHPPPPKPNQTRNRCLLQPPRPQKPPTLPWTVLPHRPKSCHRQPPTSTRPKHKTPSLETLFMTTTTMSPPSKPVGCPRKRPRCPSNLV